MIDVKEEKKSTIPSMNQNSYPCPVCRCGEISELALMEAFACNFCQHIFTLNHEQGTLKMADREPPLSWRWNGQKWYGAHLQGVELGLIYWIGAITLIILPTTIIGLSAYAFPPLPGSRLSWFPFVWTGVTFAAHSLIVIWLILEFYQFPFFAYLRALSRYYTRQTD